MCLLKLSKHNILKRLQHFTFRRLFLLTLLLVLFIFALKSQSLKTSLANKSDHVARIASFTITTDETKATIFITICFILNGPYAAMRPMAMRHASLSRRRREHFCYFHPNSQFNPKTYFPDQNLAHFVLCWPDGKKSAQRPIFYRPASNFYRPAGNYWGRAPPSTLPPVGTSLTETPSQILEGVYHFHSSSVQRYVQR